MSILVICPTRGRGPKVINEVLETFYSTKELETTELVFAIDPDDDSYFKTDEPITRHVRFYIPDRLPGGMGAALNIAAEAYRDDADILGFIGDDHRFRSQGWDRELESALANGGIAYGDDLVQGPNLCTQWFVTTDILRTLGWLALPVCKHFYLDNAWMDLGHAVNCLYYVPTAKIEHMHFSYGKSEYDDTYARTMQVGSADAALYRQWHISGGFAEDLNKVREALDARKTQ